MTDRLARLRRDPAGAGLFVDFDGTLCDIVARPELAVPSPDARQVLAALASSYGLIAVVSGRPAADVRRLLGVFGIRIFGIYGLEAKDPPELPSEVRDQVGLAAKAARSWVEDKGPSVAVHFREAEDPEGARRALEASLGPLAERFGLKLLRGKRVLELAPTDTPGKGAVVLREARERRLRACLYAGDDVADLEAFMALDQLDREGLVTVKVAVRSGETPEELLAAADIVVDRPSGLVELLTRLVPDEPGGVSPSPGR